MKEEYTFDIPDELYEALVIVAKDTDRSLAHVIRCALRNYLASRDPLETEPRY